MNIYIADDLRYEKMSYRRCGKSGLLLPEISLGFWQNFSDSGVFAEYSKIILRAFDLGITHFDLANNYGTPAGSAETNLGRLVKNELKPYRDELIISTKAGYDMWQGPYGDGGSKKYLIASLDQSLKRLGLDYVDIFYSHRPDYNTPLEETMDALIQSVKQGKALYVGLSNYDGKRTQEAVDILSKAGVRCLIHQPKYSLIKNEPQTELFPVLKKNEVGCIAFQCLAQGLLTSRYLNGIPTDSRISKNVGSIRNNDINPELLEGLRQLNEIAANRGQTLAQMAIAWALSDERVTSVLLGASSIKQLEENVLSLSNKLFTAQELEQIDKCLGY